MIQAHVMEVETERLLLRKYTKDDADAHLAIVNDPQFRTHFPAQYMPTRDGVLVGIGRFLEQWYQFGYGVWLLELKSEGRMVGYCGMRHLVPTDEVELLYGIDKDYWRRGLAFEAARASLRYGFEEMGFERVMAVTVHGNAGSRRVMEKCGLRYERDDRYFDVDCVYYAIDRADYRRDDAAPYSVRRPSD